MKKLIIGLFVIACVIAIYLTTQGRAIEGLGLVLGYMVLAFVAFVITDVISQKGIMVRSLVDRLTSLEQEAGELIVKLRQVDMQPTARQFIDPEEILCSLDALLENYDTFNKHEQQRILHSMIDTLTVERDGNVLRGTVYFYNDFMPTSQCPRREAKHTHKTFYEQSIDFSIGYSTGYNKKTG